MTFGAFKVPKPVNEPIKGYAPGSPERTSLKAKLDELSSADIEVPLIIGGREVRTGNLGDMRVPHEHGHILGRYHKAGPEEIEQAIEAARESWAEWSAMPWHARMSVFLRMAELLAGPWRDTVNAATMLAQSKNAFQAEVDSACELIDFWRFNPWYAQAIYGEQPPYSLDGAWNFVEQRPLEGFIFAVTPFNFTSIAGNLPTSPAMMGNTLIWKPASSAVFSAYYLMKLFEEAGLPPGVINFVPGSGASVGNPVLANPELAGIHFTGSTATFQSMWKTIGTNIHGYNTYPRIVGETGGKDFVFAHASADVPALAVALVRGAFEYQGQKCSAASRAYIPESIWPALREAVFGMLDEIKMGPVTDFTNFVNAVIDKAAFESIREFIEFTKSAADGEIIYGGKCDDSVGYYIEPTVIKADNPHFRTMEEEIFGPVLTIYVYKDADYEDTLRLCDTTSPYALTGAVFANDRGAIQIAYEALRFAAGNFYINDKPTGAVVGQQPFGGGRASGTNDKAGSYINLLKWVSPRTVKENFIPPKDYKYPFLES
ncbi:L-glutamate gamma-semialdehyde dehydrogenase [bacterium]|nr:L-glutamate gamma-semialdehyde dehydrogenase [bacterium]